MPLVLSEAGTACPHIHEMHRDGYKKKHLFFGLGFAIAIFCSFRCLKNIKIHGILTVSI